MSAHTKGPWVISGGGSLHLSVLSQDDEQTIADVWFIRRDPEEGNANARLIAASPDLLEALQAAVHLYTQYGLVSGAPVDGISGGRWVNEARAAIARATGEQP